MTETLVLVSTGIALALMAGVVVLFRLMVRRPRGLSHEDPPAIRTVAVFHGDDLELFGDDREEEPLVGVRLFRQLCQGLTARGITVEERGPLQNAQAAQCLVDEERLRIVLEWHEDCWVASVEYFPQTPAEARHMRLTRAVYAPRDSRAVRRLLGALDSWLKTHPKLSGVAWHRKENWLEGRFSGAAPSPILSDEAGTGS